MRKARRLAWVALCVVALPCLSQQIYKWTDASGTVHYSEQAPPANVKKTKLTLSGLGAEEAPAAASSAPAIDNAAVNSANKGQTTHMCAVARQNLKLLDSSSMVTSGSDIATATQLRGEQREKARAEAETQIAQYCHDQ